MTPGAAMIFAAGRGTRMGALTATRPKPLIVAAGRPLIDHALAIVRDAGIGRIVINTHHLAPQLAAHLARHAPEATVIHEPVLLETGGGLRNALAALGPGPVFALNADAVWRGPNPLTLLARDWDPARMEALMLGVPTGAARAHAGPGDLDLDAAGRVIWRRGRRAALVYAGAQIIATDRLAAMAAGAFTLHPVWEAMRAEGRLFGTVYPGDWVDVGRPEGIAAADALVPA